MKKRKTNLAKMTVTAVLTAAAYLTVVVIKIPVNGFLELEFKDAITAILSLMFGPLYGVLSSVVLALLELVTISDSGMYGLIMNAVSSVAFTGIVGIAYKYRRTLGGAVAGFAVSVLVTTALMLGANCVITPLFTGMPREAIIKMLLPLFLPFNLIKYTLNAAVSVLLYKPLIGAFRKMGLAEKTEAKTFSKKSIAVTVSALAVLAACAVLLFAVFK